MNGEPNKTDGMTDDELMKALVRNHMSQNKNADDGEYEINKTQIGYLINIIEFFKNLEKKKRIKVSDIMLVPHDEHGCFEVSFKSLNLEYEEVPNMCVHLCRAIGLSIDTDDDGTIHMAGIVPDVFVRKK